MAKGAYIGVSNVAKKVKKMYIGVGGVARKVKKAYIGVNGVARLFWSGESFRALVQGYSNNNIYSSEEPQPTTSSFNSISNPFSSLTGKYAWILWDKKYRRFIAINKDLTNSDANHRNVYYLSEGSSTWILAGQLPYNQYTVTTKYGIPFIDDNGNILLKIGSSLLHVYINESGTLTIGKTKQVFSDLNTSDAGNASQIKKVGEYYTSVWRDNSSGSSYFNISYSTDVTLNSAWTRKQIYNDYTIVCSGVLGLNPLYYYNGNFYAVFQGLAPSISNDYSINVFKGTSLSNIARVSVNYANLRQNVLAYIGNKAFFNNDNSPSYGSRYPSVGIHSVNLSSYALTKETSTYLGNSSLTNNQETLAYIYDGTLHYVFSMRDKVSSSSSNYKICLYYSTDFLTWTYVDLYSLLGYGRGNNPVGFAITTSA